MPGPGRRDTLRRMSSAAALDTGTPAPDFTLPAHTGGTVRLSALRGRPVVLYFMREFT